MCGLMTALTMLQGGLSAAGSIMQGNAQAKAAEAQARVAENNRKMAENAVSEAGKEGAREQMRFRQNAAQFAASQESQLAASGVALSGSAANVLADTAMGIEQDADMIRFNSLKKRWGYQVEATNYANEASAAKASAKNARLSGRIGAATSLIGTGLTLWQNGAFKGTRAKGGQITVGGGQGQSLALPRWDEYARYTGAKTKTNTIPESWWR